MSRELGHKLKIGGGEKGKQMKKVGIVLAALLIATMIATSVSAHTMRGIEFTIDSPNPEPVITIITHDNGSYTFKNAENARLLCPFGLIRILMELKNAIEEEISCTRNGWILVEVQ